MTIRWGKGFALALALLLALQLWQPVGRADAAISRAFWENRLFTLPKEPYDEQTAKLMMDRILRIEPDVLETLIYRGVRIKLVNGPITDEPEMAALRDVVPRGWENTGKTWSDIPGVGGNPVIVRIGYSDEGMGHGSYNLELHETFHAIDDYVLQGASAHPVFREAFREEAGILFGGNGYEELYPEEYFAEAAAMLYYSEDTRAMVADKLPMTYAYLVGILEAHEAEPPAFRALEGHWAADALNRLVALRIISGYPDGTLRPGTAITREQFAKLLVETLGLPLGSAAEATFADVRAAAWSAPYIEALVENGIVEAAQLPNGRFRPIEAISRKDMAVWTVRALGLTPDAAALSFADLNDIAAESHGEVGAAVSNGLMNGVPGNRFAPEDSVTRAEAALLLYRVLELPSSDTAIVTSSDQA